MGEIEEETYSTVFTALKHPVRRRILRTLAQSSQAFTDLQSAFKINSAVLTFHLDAMKDLVFKTEEGKYSLSTMGEGAIALMERVEDPPKTTPTNPSPKSSKRLSIIQAAAIGIAVILVVSGTYLTSISPAQSFYDVPTEWSLTDYFPDDTYPEKVGGSDFYRIDRNSYDVRYSLFVYKPSRLLNQLEKEYQADIWVNLKTNETAPSALCYVTLNYENTTADGSGNIYYKNQQDFYGMFQPVNNPGVLEFSTHLTFQEAHLKEQISIRVHDIRFNIWTNTTLPGIVTGATIADFLSVKASATEEFYSETRPYESQGIVITIIGIILLVAALIMSVLSLLRKRLD